MKCDQEYIGEDNAATWDNVSLLKLNEQGALQMLVLQHVLTNVINGREQRKKKLSVFLVRIWVFVSSFCKKKKKIR